MMKGKKGFTLIELVVVIAILGILAGIAIPRFLDATATARGAKILADMRTIDSAAVIYNAKTGVLPTESAQLTESVDGMGSAAHYQLLATWPTPPSGTAKITNNQNVEVDITPSATSYVISGGRATLGGNNVDQLLSTGTSSN